MSLKRGNAFCTLERIIQDIIVQWVKLLYLTLSEVTEINHESLAAETFVQFCSVLSSFGRARCQLNDLEFKRVP